MVGGIRSDHQILNLFPFYVLRNWHNECHLLKNSASFALYYFDKRYFGGKLVYSTPYRVSVFVSSEGVVTCKKISSMGASIQERWERIFRENF